jgi:polysaccharide export outer membrane protein
MSYQQETVSRLQNIRLILLFLAVLFLTSSCGSVKLENMLMFEAVQTEQGAIDSIPVLVIQPDDILNIQVASRNPETTLAFQQYRVSSSTAGIGENAMGMQEGYRVDEEGMIQLPFLNTVQAAGKTLVELRKEITAGLTQYIPDASVQIRFMNFRVTLMGEVNRPNTYTIPNERLTVLEAIGMAGDYTPYANRNEVLVIRERNGIREFDRINTQERSVFSSPFFYLSPNDIVYVAPLKAKQYATTGDFFQRYGPLFYPLVSIITFLIGASINRR